MTWSLVYVVISVVLFHSDVVISSDESPGFFLKITKNVPRLGRRSDKQFESYFFKNAKQIPRIGRRSEVDDSDLSESDISAWLNEATLVKRSLINPILAMGHREYTVVQPVNANTLIELIEKDAIPSDNIKFVHWKDFDRALQADNDLYTKVVSLGRRPDRQLKNDLNLSRYVPFFGNTNYDDDLMLYRGQKEVYPTRDKDVLHYNNI